MPLAYRALRSAYNDPQMHLGYTVGLFLTGRIAQGHVETPEQVAPDTAVVLAKIGPSALPAILNGLKSSNESLRYGSALALKYMGRSTPAVDPAVAQRSEQLLPGRRQWAVGIAEHPGNIGPGVAAGRGAGSLDHLHARLRRLGAPEPLSRALGHGRSFGAVVIVP